MELADGLNTFASFLAGFGIALLFAHRRERRAEEMRSFQKANEKWQIQMWQEKWEQDKRRCRQKHKKQLIR